MRRRCAANTTDAQSGAHEGTSSYTERHEFLTGGNVAITVLLPPSGSIVVMNRSPSEAKIPLDATRRPFEPQSTSPYPFAILVRWDPSVRIVNRCRGKLPSVNATRRARGDSATDDNVCVGAWLTGSTTLRVSFTRSSSTMREPRLVNSTPAALVARAENETSPMLGAKEVNT